MSFLIVLAALVFLMFVAYRGYSVIMFAPVAALLAVLLTDPAQVLPMFSGVFLDKMVGFIKLYFPVFMLGAIFGKVIELSGFSKSIVSSVIKFVGQKRAMLSIVLVCAILTYGGVSLFVVVFAVYPFAAEMFRQSDIPKRLIPGTIALGAFTFTMDSLPGTPQIQNIIPTTFFKTTTYAAPWLGIIGSVFILVVGLVYLDWRRRRAAADNEGYGTDLVNEPEPFEEEKLVNPWIALLPLVLVGVFNKVFTVTIPQWYGTAVTVPLKGHPVTIQVASVAAIWAVEGALLVGILCVLVFAFKPVMAKFADGTKAAVAGSLLAAMNTASEYGFGGVIAALPRFHGRRRCAEGDPESPGQRGDHGQRACRHHRFGLGRHEHCAGGDVGNLHPGRQCGAHPARGAAPGRIHGERRHGHAAAQRRGHHAAGGHRADPSHVVQRHLRGDPH